MNQPYIARISPVKRIRSGQISHTDPSEENLVDVTKRKESIPSHQAALSVYALKKLNGRLA